MDKIDQDSFYSVSRFLNEPRRILGCTMDEFLPAFLVGFMGFVGGFSFYALLFVMVWVLSLKALKSRYGMNIVMITIYWYCPREISQSIFKETPPSDYKFWLS
jgi:conjugal transfer pilus assembly protein TraL